ncbi:hypothetical protein [Streptomyces violaceorubidus]|uniref:hypothetical protein n=1 Tax=Streptomyces violaceorubidus TaxID=284042 RepID=UPI0012FEF0BE|nr:hypothetical protein [Streptomyces violaceorubidus]
MALTEREPQTVQILRLKPTTLLVREGLAALPPRSDRQKPDQLGKTDGHQSRSSFSPQKKKVPPAPSPANPSSAGEEVGGIFLLTEGSDQRLHVPHPTAPFFNCSQ